MADRIPILYWDTCIFLEHLRDESVDPAKKRAVIRILEENAEKKNRIITSTLTHAEAIPRKITIIDAVREDQYWKYFNGIYFLDEDVSRPIMLLAREIRDFYYKEADAKTGLGHRMVGLADAIHLATAIVVGADEFHTRDGRSRGGNVGILKIRNLTDNRKINKRWELNIISPEDPQGDILDGLPP